MLDGAKQIHALCSVSFRSIPERWASSLVIVLGVAGVVAVLLSVLSISGSLERTIAGSGRMDRAIVLQRSAVSENGSILERDAATRIQSAVGIRKTTDGRPIISTEALAPLRVLRYSDGRRDNVMVRGVSPTVFELRPEMKVLAGRPVRPGFHEVMVGRRAVEHFRGLRLGDRVKFRNAEWAVVGVFGSEGDTYEMEVLTDVEMLLSAGQRYVLNSISVLLESPESYGAFRDMLTSDPALVIKVSRESEYYQLQSEPLRSTWSFLAYVVSSVMALGAMFGAANTMYSAVSARRAEIATLRAVGFGPNAVLVSVLLEAMALAIAGALLGAAIVWLMFNGQTFSTRLGSGSVVTRLSLDARLVLLGIAWACGISILGALAPAARVSNQSVAEALRAI
ncbi:MAG: ABC transporter permease [Gammaproteobacteria bacterium]